MTIHLPEPLESSIRAAVHSGRYASLDDAMAEAASLLVQRLKQEQTQAAESAASEAAPSAHKPIWEVIEDENRSIPPDYGPPCPLISSEQHDHYIYGTLKRPAE